jgi:rhodanese-related sulfurtransferase
MNTSIPSVNPSELSNQLRSQPAPQLIDVREYAEFAGGRITGAMLVPLAELRSRAASLDPKRPVVLVCHSGNRSAQGCQQLCELGFENVIQLAGGMLAWRQAGLPIEKDARAPWALERQVRLVAGSLVLTGLALAHFWPNAIALTWFVGAGLVIAALTNSCLMGMLLAKLPWNRPSSSSNIAAPNQSCCSAKP